MTEPATDAGDAAIDAAIAYKLPGWSAFSPARHRASGRALSAVILVGSARDGWNKILTVRGADRFDRVAALVARYNAAPAASVITDIAIESEGIYSDQEIPPDQDDENGQ
jgi:hypothetical protein